MHVFIKSFVEHHNEKWRDNFPPLNSFNVGIDSIQRSAEGADARNPVRRWHPAGHSTVIVREEMIR